MVMELVVEVDEEAAAMKREKRKKKKRTDLSRVLALIPLEMYVSAMLLTPTSTAMLHIYNQLRYKTILT
jgi:hypothetical protein